MHIAAENRTNTKTLYFGGSRSFKVMIRSISMFICNCFYVRRANIGKITSFYMGTPLWRLRMQASLNIGGRDFDY